MLEPETPLRQPQAQGCSELTLSSFQTEPSRAHPLGGETLTRHLFLGLVFSLSCCPRGSAKELEVLLLLNACKGSFLRGWKKHPRAHRNQTTNHREAVPGGVGGAYIMQSFVLWCSRSRTTRLLHRVFRGCPLNHVSCFLWPGPQQC